MAHEEDCKDHLKELDHRRVDVHLLLKDPKDLHRLHDAHQLQNTRQADHLDRFENLRTLTGVARRVRGERDEAEDLG